MRFITTMLLGLAGLSTFAIAAVPAAPEIDPSSATQALVLVSGALLMLRSGRRK